MIPQVIAFLVISGALLIVGVRGLFRRKPQIFSSRWVFGLVVLSFLPSLLIPATGRGNVFDADFSDLPGSLLTLFSGMVVFLVVMLFLLWKTLQGYTLIGITDDSLRQALHHALGARCIPYEERLSAVRLTALDAELKIAVQSWLGSGTIAIRPARRGAELDAIVVEMRRFFANNDIATNRVTPFLHALVGLMTLVTSLGIFQLQRDFFRRHDGSHLVGTVAPNFAMTTLDGGRFELADSIGREIVALNFFATWCGPCKAEMPELVRLAHAPREIPVKLIGIDAYEHPRTVEAFVREQGIDFPVGIDTSIIREQYGVNAYPVTVIIGLDGRVQAHHGGALHDAREFFSEAELENRELLDSGKTASKEDYLRDHDLQQRESMPVPLREPRVLTREVPLEKSPVLSYESACETATDIAWGEFHELPGKEILLVDCASIRFLSADGGLLDQRALPQQMHFPKIVRTGVGSADWILVDEGRFDRVLALRSSGETLFEKEEQDVWFGATAGDLDGDPKPEFAIYRYNSGVIELREDDGAFLRRFDTGDAVQWLTIWDPPDAPPRLLYSILDDDLVQLDVEGKELARHKPDSPALNFLEEVFWADASSEPLYLQTYWDTLHLLEPGGRRARRLVSPLLDEQLLWTPLRATTVPRPDGSGRFLAVAARLWKHPRSAFHLYDAEGKLVYYELLEGMYGGVAAIEESGRPATILLAGRDQLLRYELR